MVHCLCITYLKDQYNLKHKAFPLYSLPVHVLLKKVAREIQIDFRHYPKDKSSSIYFIIYSLQTIGFISSSKSSKELKSTSQIMTGGQSPTNELYLHSSIGCNNQKTFSLLFLTGSTMPSVNPSTLSGGTFYQGRTKSWTGNLQTLSWFQEAYILFLFDQPLKIEIVLS